MPAPKNSIKRQEWIEKIRDHNIKTGKRPPSRAGISPSLVTRKKQSISMKRNGHVPPNLLGRKRTQDFKDRVSKNHKRPWLGKRGTGTPNYKDGKTPENHKIRTSLEMKLWKKSCLLCGNFTCQKYGIKGGILEVHHINNFADFPELRFVINNGVVLSEKAHMEFHKKYGRKNNTRAQLEEFLTK